MTRQLDESFRYCERLTKQQAGNFYYSFLTLPAPLFRDMCALYAFMRATDDLGDSSEPADVRGRQLAQWRMQLGQALSGADSGHPALPAVVDMIHRHTLPLTYLDDVIRGVEMDLQPARFATFPELERYCYHVAGAVGLCCVQLWGANGADWPPLAIDCGTAFQLTNILRDIREDALQGRVYLPQDSLDRSGVTFEMLSAASPTPEFLELMALETARARNYYERSAPLARQVSPVGRPILDAMRRIYGGLLDEIERRNYDVLSQRVALSRWRKLSIAASTYARHRFSRIFSGGTQPPLTSR